MRTKASVSLVMGVLFALFNALMLSSMSLFAKLLAQYFGPVEVTFFRNIFALTAIFIWIILSGRLNVLKTKRPVAHLIRGTIGTVGIVMGSWALAIMPLAETTTLLFTAPLFVVLLSYPVLKEPVGPYRLGAVLLGFMGVIIIVNPTFNTENLPLLGVLIGLAWGFSAGCVDVCLRWMGKTENSFTTVFYFVLFGTLTTGLHWPYAEVKPDSFSLDAFWIIIGIGTTGLLSLLSKTQSFRLAEASVIAPVMYTMIIWAMLFDFMLWDKTPKLNVVVGAVIIITSNLFILYRESRIRKLESFASAPEDIHTNE